MRALSEHKMVREMGRWVGERMGRCGGGQEGGWMSRWTERRMGKIRDQETEGEREGTQSYRIERTDYSGDIPGCFPCFILALALPSGETESCVCAEMGL